MTPPPPTKKKKEIVVVRIIELANFPLMPVFISGDETIFDLQTFTLAREWHEHNNLVVFL